MGVDASFEAFPQHRAWSMIVRGERDGIIGPMRSSKLEQTCSFPDQPLFPEKRVLWVRTTDSGKLKFSSFEDLVGHEVAVTSLSSLEDSELSPELSKFLREHHNAVNANSLPETFQMLEAGRVDYALVGFGLGKRYIGALGLSGRIEPLLSHSFGEGGFGVCFTKGRVSPAFVDAFSRALRQFKQTEAYQALYRKYAP
jgi:polar amino acid transport system substrate-binding protein